MTGRPAPDLADRQLAEAPILGTLAILLRHPVIMTLVPLFFFSLAVTFTVTRRQWTATAKITPQAPDNPLSGLLGMATQVGGGGGGGIRNNESVDFYSDLFKSRELLDSLAVTPFKFFTGPPLNDTLSGTYMDIHRIPGQTEFERLYRARRRLEGRVGVTLKRASAVVTVTTRAQWGMLAEQMNRRLLDLANQFNVKRRQTQARSERTFLEARMAETSEELKAAQAAQRAFLQRNRVYQDDPALASEAQNLARRVSETEGVYGAVVQSYERARADEARNTSQFTIVESPEGSRKRSGGLFLNALLGLCVGTIVAAALALGLEYAAAERRRFPEAYQTVLSLARPRFLRRG